MKNDLHLSSYELSDCFKYLHSIADPPENVAIELHNFYELYFFISGNIIFYIEGQAYQMQPYDILVINYDELHRATALDDQPYERIVIHFNNNYLSGFSSDDYHLLDFLTKRKLGQFNLLKADESRNSDYFKKLKIIDSAVSENSSHKHLRIKTLFLQLLIEMSSAYEVTPKSIISPKQSDDRILDILNYINNHISEKITLNLLEKKFYMNRYYLCHLFKKNTGFTVFEYISNKRIMKAKQFLEKGYTVMETCDESGFNDYSHFYKVFKRVTGLSPKKYAMQK